MNQTLPCPNPACTHQFSARELAAASGLRCPRCGTHFQFRAKPTPQPAPATARPASPSAPAKPASLPQRPAAPTRVFRRGWFLFGLLAIMVAGGAYALRSGLFQKAGQSVTALTDSIREDDSTAHGPAHVSRDFNYRFVFPGDAWQMNDRLKVEVKANALAMQRTRPSAWFALAARDYKKSNPDAGKLTDEAVQRLGSYFTAFEWEPKTEIDLAGQKALRLIFQGKVNGKMMSGECCSLAHKGVAYWLTAWTTAEEAQQNAGSIVTEFERLRKGFSLGKDREQWKELRVAHTFKGKKAPYELRDASGPWKEWDDPTSEDSKADLLLIGADPDDARDVSRQAIVAVLLLDKKEPSQAISASQEHVEAHQKETFPETTLESAGDKEDKQDKEVKIGNVLGRVSKLRVKNGETRERFLMLAIVVRDDLDRMIVVQCECDWRRRARWEALFQELLSRFRLGGGDKQ